MPAARKRLRDAAELFPEAPLSEPPAALRATLASRAGRDALPASWRAAAAAAGASGADAYLCHLGRSIVDALRAVPVAAEAARAQLRSTREALLSAVNSRCDELESRIAAAESDKIASLERELCAVDAALEQLRAERGAAAAAAATLGDIELASRHADLTSRLDAAEVRLLSLPTSVVEPPHVGLITDAPALLSCITTFGRVVVPRAITAADLTLEGVPYAAHPGHTLRLRAVLESAQHVSQSAEELEVSLGAAAAAMHVEASLLNPGASPQPLKVDSSIDVLARCVVVSLVIPISALAGSTVSVSSLHVLGWPLSGKSDFPSIRVRRGVQAPLKLMWMEPYAPPDSLCISRSGQIFVPQPDSPDVLVFDSDGSQLPSIVVAALGPNVRAQWTAFVNTSPSVLLFCGDDRNSSVVAADPATGVVLWATAPLPNGCEGFAVFSDRDVVITFDNSNELVARRLSDGKRLGGLVSMGTINRGGLTADPATASFYSSSNVIADEDEDDDDSYAVERFTWTETSGFSAEGVVKAAGVRDLGRPLTVVPPAQGKRVSHLVVGAYCESELLVFSLPDLNLVHTHRLKGMRITALAADPWGEALAACDFESKSTHVLAWPLPGMPVLE